MKPKILLAVLLSIALSGCVQTKYQWGEYSERLLELYKDPKTSDEYIKELDNITNTNVLDNKPVPPGIYAEFGYMLLVSGKNNEAVKLFEREKKMWPEATTLMNRMIELSLIKGN